MTPQEFKAWFDGFTEAMGGIPTKAQWARIKERVGEIDGKTVTEHHYISRYWQYLQAPTPVYPTWTTYCAGTSGNANQAAIGSALSNVNAAGFNGLTAMYALGRAEGAGLGIAA